MKHGQRELTQADVAIVASSAAPAQQANEHSVRLARILVKTEGAEVAAFQRETGAPIDGFVPVTYPFCWLTLPVVRSLIGSMIGEHFLPVHEEQTFELQRNLELDAEYHLAVELRREAEPPRLIVEAAISTPRGETCGRFETILRIIPLAFVPAS
jgi:hypothetical protein